MARKKQDEARRVESTGDDGLEAAIRAGARSIEERLETQYPEIDDLTGDPDFARLSNLLAGAEAPVETVERLSHASQPIVAAIAHCALAKRDDVSTEWVGWAFRRLGHAYAGELFFLLPAIERHGEPPFIAPVLARSTDDWSWGWCLGVITAFVQRRVKAGETPTADDFEAAVDRSDEERVAEVVAELEGTLPAATVREFEQWRRRRAQLDFFSSIGRIWETAEGLPALTSVAGREAVAAAVADGLRKPTAQSVLLVGEHGVGKSAVIREALRPFLDEGWFVFEAGPADVLADQKYIGELEGRVRELVERALGKPVVWVMPAFEGALWAGQHTRSPRGLLDVLLPHVEAGRLVIVGELEPRAYDLLVQQRPRVRSAFETLRLEPLSREEAIAVAGDWRDRVGADVDAATIGDAQDLAQHYLAGVAAPAGVLRLLKATLARAAREGRENESMRTEHVLETLSEATGLPLHVVDPQAPLDLDDVRRFFSSRVLGQPEAVDCLVDRIALIKASLTDPTRPLGVFLFVGPTGTGKTEIAKALAEFLFGSPDRLVRLDMSEFQTERSLERLLADSTSDAEAATLISSVRSNPFSVVLLDEFEKAHRNIWNVFLQLFDDGRLTDRQGRTADFRRCVVILTSNLGAAVGTGRRLGFASDGGPSFRPAAVERELSRVFRPELLNRIDRVVVFRPFDREQMRELLERELATVLERRGFRARPWAVEWDDAAIEFLVEKGFSPEFGARPLKRAVERYLLAPLATAIVSRSFPEGEQFLLITARDERIEVTFVDPDSDEPVPATPSSPAQLRLESLVLEPGGSSEASAFLQAETERLRAIIDGETWRGRKERDLEAMQDESFWDSPERFTVLARVEYVDRVQAAFRTAEKLAARLSRLSRNGHGPARNLVELLAERLYLLDRACDGTDPSDPADAFVEVRASGVDQVEGDFAVQLCQMYESWGRRRGMRVRRLWADGGQLLAVFGIGAYQILAPENGLHVFESPHDERSFDRSAVRVAVAPCRPVAPDTDLAELARLALAELPPSATIVRRYRTKPSPLVRDSVRDWRTGRLDRVLAGEFDVIVPA